MAISTGLPGWAGTRKVKPIWIYWSKRQWVAVAYEILHHAQINNHASTHHLVFTGQTPFLPPNQQRQSTEGIYTTHRNNTSAHKWCKVSCLRANSCQICTHNPHPVKPTTPTTNSLFTNFDNISDKTQELVKQLHHVLNQ